MRKIVSIFTVVFAVFVVTSCGQPDAPLADQAADEATQNAAEFDGPAPGEGELNIPLTPQGSSADNAPQATENVDLSGDINFEDRKNSAEQTVVSFMRAYMSKDLGRYYDMIHSEDQALKPFEQLEREFAPGAEDIVTDFIFSRTNIQVQKDMTQVTASDATVFLKTSAPQLGTVIRNAAVVERDINQLSYKTRMDILGQRYNLDGSPKDRRDVSYKLGWEDDKWKVRMQWADLSQPPPSE